ncbi:MAG TPA: YfiR family protein [Verrucomicrobiae bacterium]|nr:YfiR family protein [Verrucomicrobiae bacterium]
MRLVRRRALIRVVWLLFGVVLGVGPQNTIRAAEISEYALKAEFLCNFPDFTTWPETAFATAESPIVIGILGTDPFGSVLDQTVVRKTINGRHLVVRRLKDLSGARECHVLFIAESEMRKLPEILNSLGSSPILTVGDSEGFARRGGMINLRLEGRKIRFEINLKATEQTNLRLRSQLIKLGTLVGDKPAGDR